jgi:hypothetical protein
MRCQSFLLMFPRSPLPHPHPPCLQKLQLCSNVHCTVLHVKGGQKSPGINTYHKHSLCEYIDFKYETYNPTVRKGGVAVLWIRDILVRIRGSVPRIRTADPDPTAKMPKKKFFFKVFLLITF